MTALWWMMSGTFPLWSSTRKSSRGKYSEPVEFGSSPCGQNSYKRYLYKIPMVVTINHSTSRRELLHEDDFLGNPKNRIFFEPKESPFMDGAPASCESTVVVLPQQS